MDDMITVIHELNGDKFSWVFHNGINDFLMVPIVYSYLGFISTATHFKITT